MLKIEGSIQLSCGGVIHPLTREEAQRQANDLYALGHITREQWRELTDQFSDTTEWAAEGRLCCLVGR